MNKIILWIAAAVISIVCITGCGLLGGEGSEDPLVVTTEANLQVGAEYAIVPVDQLPRAIRDSVPEGVEIVVTLLSDVTNPNKDTFPLEGAPGATGEETLVDSLLAVGGTFFPGLVAWEGLLTLLFKRKRKHVFNAVKSANPFVGGTVDLRSSMSSLASALGVRHSSPATEAVFADEVVAEVTEEAEELLVE